MDAFRRSRAFVLVAALAYLALWWRAVRQWEASESGARLLRKVGAARRGEYGLFVRTADGLYRYLIARNFARVPDSALWRPR